MSMSYTLIMFVLRAFFLKMMVAFSTIIFVLKKLCTIDGLLLFRVDIIELSKFPDLRCLFLPLINASGSLSFSPLSKTFSIKIYGKSVLSLKKVSLNVFAIFISSAMSSFSRLTCSCKQVYLKFVK